MTEPIRDKFDRLEEGMVIRHAQLMDVLGDLQTSIEPPIDYSSGFLAIGQKLDLANENLGLLNAALVAVAQLLPDWITTTTAINNGIATANSKLTTMDDNLQQVQQTLGLHNGGAEFTLASLVRAISAGIGLINENTLGIKTPWPTNVLAALECICDATSSLLPIDPLDPTNPNTCDTPFVSTGFNLFPVVIPGFGSAIIYATWQEPLPDGIEWGTSVLGAISDGILSADDWNGWRVFVQSDEVQYADDPVSPNRYPTNQWREMEGSGARVFSVSERGSLTVYLCYTEPEGPVPAGECINIPINVPDNEGYMQVEIPVGYPANYTYTVLKDGFYGRAGPQGNFNGPHTGNVPYTAAQLAEYGTWIYTNSRDVYQLQVCNPLV
jgi:hypothetical protein